MAPGALPRRSVRNAPVGWVTVYADRKRSTAREGNLRCPRWHRRMRSRNIRAGRLGLTAGRDECDTAAATRR